MAAARLNGGSIENIDPGFEAIKKLKPNVQMMYTQPDQLIPLFERGDIAVAVWYTDRTGAAAAKGVPVAAAYPKEGAIGIVPTVSVPKASQKKELAQKYIATLLSPEGQLCFAQSQFAGPTNKTVKLPAGSGQARALWRPRAAHVLPRHGPRREEVPGVVGALGARDRTVTGARAQRGR